jgi:hypothetical protein
MSGRILQFEARRHDEAMRLLPWLLTGRLDDADRAWLEPHVDGCAECRRELDALRDVQAACRPDPDRDPPGLDAAAPDADRGWDRLRARLQPPVPAAGASWRSRRPPPRRRERWQRWALAAQAAVIAVLAVVAWRTPAPAEYRTLGAAPPANAGNLVIVFDPALDESHLRSLLLASQARIVDGPNDAGAYVLAVPPARLPIVQDALRAAPGVTLVAALGPGQDP